MPDSFCFKERVLHPIGEAFRGIHRSYNAAGVTLLLKHLTPTYFDPLECRPLCTDTVVHTEFDPDERLWYNQVSLICDRSPMLVQVLQSAQELCGDWSANSYVVERLLKRLRQICAGGNVENTPVQEMRKPLPQCAESAPSHHCGICLSDKFDSPCKTTCGHWHCRGCIFKWFKKGTMTCP